MRFEFGNRHRIEIIILFSKSGPRKIGFETLQIEKLEL